MKWIRLFEELGTDDYYKEITFNQYYDRSWSNEYYVNRRDVVRMPNGLLSRLRKSLKDYVDEHKYSRDIDLDENGHDVLIVGRFPGKYFHIEFYMYGEEWFKCMYFDVDDKTKKDNRHYYICDQYTGLIKLLKDLKIII